MFRREDYWPYMFGVFVFAGVIALPTIYSNFIDLPFDRLLAGCLLGCFLFAFAHTRDGQFSFGRFIGGVALMVLALMRTAGKSDGQGGVIPGGLLGFAVMAAAGWFGIAIGRATGISKALKSGDSRTIVKHGQSAEVGQKVTLAGQPEHVFSDDMYRALVNRTYFAWHTGKPSALSVAIKNQAKMLNMEQFATVFTSAKEAIAFAFQIEPPDDDEYIIAAENADHRLSYLLTSRYFYYFGLDKDLFASKYPAGKIALRDIRKCEIIQGFVFPKATIALYDGKIISIDGFNSERPILLIQKLIMLPGAIEASA